MTTLKGGTPMLLETKKTMLHELTLIRDMIEIIIERQNGDRIIDAMSREILEALNQVTALSEKI